MSAIKVQNDSTINGISVVGIPLNKMVSSGAVSACVVVVQNKMYVNLPSLTLLPPCI